MSQPYSIFNNATPNRIENKANWLGRYLAVEKGFSEKLSRVLSDAALNIDDYFESLVKENVSTKVARVRIALAHKEIRRQMRDIFGTTKNLIRNHQQDAAVAAVNAKLYDEKGVLSLLFPDPVNRFQYADSLRQTAKRNIESTIVRTLFTEKPLSARVYKTEALANGLVSKTINNALARGDSARNLAKDVRALIDPAVPGGVSYAAMRLGRTELNNAFHAQSILDTQETPWVDQMRWHLSKRHEKDNCECEKYAATGTFNKERVPEKPHPNCFSGETLVTAQSVRAVSKRWYDGSFIDVFCAEDSPQLSGTPNHPALTKRGWVPLSELREGDYLAVNPLRDNTSGFSIPNHDYVQTRIEDIFESFRMSVGVSVVSVPGATKQFHGDGIIGENVDIVLTDSLLQNGWNSKGFSEGAFLGSGMALLNLFSFSSFDQTVNSVFLPSSGDIGSQSPRLTLLSGHDSSRLSVVSEAKTVGREHLSQLHETPSGSFTDLFCGKSAGVEFVRVERITERPGGFRGHVYNLSTESGWYTVDHGIDSTVVSNCRCFVTPELPDYEDFERGLLSGEYDPYLDSVMGQGFSEGNLHKGAKFSVENPATPKKSGSVKWTGPKVGEPLKLYPEFGEKVKPESPEHQEILKNREINEGLRYAWQSTRFDEFKKDFRLGGRDAQRVGFQKFPSFTRDEILEAIENDRLDYLLQTDPNILRTYGREIVARAVHSEPTTKDLFRGIRIEQEELANLQVGKPLSLSLSSFDEEEHWAIDFAQGRAWKSREVEALKNPQGIILRLQEGAKVADIKGGTERIAFGQFEIVEINPPEDVTVIRLAQEVVTERPPVIVIRQTSMIEADLTGGRMSVGNQKDEENWVLKDIHIGNDMPKSVVPQNKLLRETLARAKKIMPKARIDLPEGINSQVFSEIIDEMESLAVEFPEVTDNLRAFGFTDLIDGWDEDGNAIRAPGFTQSIRDDFPEPFKAFAGQASTIHFDAELAKTRNGLKDRIKNSTKNNFQYPGVAEKPIKSLVNHEFIHAIHFAMGHQSGSEKFSEEWRNRIFKYFEEDVDAANHPERKNMPEVHKWFKEIASKMPVYASAFPEEGKPPTSFDTFHPAEFWAVGGEQGKLRPESANRIDKIIWDMFTSIYNDFVEKKPKKRRRRVKK